MTLQNKIHEVNKLHSLIHSHGKLSDDIKKRINYRFRLDWNYYSNAIEGGTLTRNETRSVMIDSLDIGGKSLRDILEMKGHDEVVKEILAIGQGNANLSEKRIKSFHKLIIKDENPENAEAIGNWKKESNHIINYKDEKYNFADPSEVPELIHKLIDKTNALLESLDTKKPKEQMVLIPLKFHLEFINIHPFYDGNGRMARILSNLLLISLGFPPFIVTTKDKDRYNKILADIQCYGGEPDLLYEFLCDLIIRSQNLVLDVINGKDIDFEDDFEKELALLDQEFADKKEASLRINNELIQTIYSNSLRNLFLEIETQLSGLDKRFNSKEIRYSMLPLVYLVEDEKMNSTLNGLENQLFFDYQQPEIYGHDVHKQYPINEKNLKRQLISQIEISYNWTGFKKAGTKAFNINTQLTVRFDEFKYAIFIPFNNNQQLVEHLYDEQLSEFDIDNVIKWLQDGLLEQIKNQINHIKSQK